MRLYITFLAVAVTSVAAVAQDQPGRPHVPNQEGASQTPKQKIKRMGNRIRLHVIHDRRDEENQHQQWAMPIQYSFQDPRFGDGIQFNNTLDFTREAWFSPPKQVKPNFDVTIAASPQKIVARQNVKPITTWTPDEPPYNSRPGTLFAGGSSSGTPLIFGGADSGEETDSGSAFLIGPELSMPIKDDLSTVDGFGWLPEKSQAFGYGKFLFGEMDVYENDSNVYLFSAGVGVRMPIITESYFGLDGIVSAGPSYLDTDFGSALGLEAQAGVGTSIRLIADLFLTGSVGISVYASENIYSWGPTFNVGLSASW